MQCEVRSWKQCFQVVDTWFALLDSLISTQLACVTPEEVDASRDVLNIAMPIVLEAMVNDLGCEVYLPRNAFMLIIRVRFGVYG